MIGNRMKKIITGATIIMLALVLFTDTKAYALDNVKYPLDEKSQEQPIANDFQTANNVSVLDKPLEIDEEISEEVEDTEVVGSKRNDKTSAYGRTDLPDYSVSVNKATNTVMVYKVEDIGTDKEKKIPYKVMLCSVGRWGHDTPEGEFKTYEYYDWRLMVDNTYGRYAVRFNGSIMFHSVPYLKMAKNTLEWEEFNKLGRPASLGCVRLCVADAKWIYSNCKKGTKVTVYSDPKEKIPLSKPKPIIIDKNSKYKDWDPTDLTKENPLVVTID